MGTRRVRFAPSPTGTLHVGNALSAVANRGFGDWMLLRIDDTDPARNVPGGEEAIVDDLGGSGSLGRGAGAAERARGALPRGGGSARRRRASTASRCCARTARATYQLASVVDDGDFGITHVIRGNDHRPNEALHRRLHEALGAEPPEYVHHGLILGEDGKKLSKRAEGATVASLRDAASPPRRCARTSRSSASRSTTSTSTSPRIRRLAIEAIAALADEELAPRAACRCRAACRLMRGARDLREAREYARSILEPEPAVAVDDARDARALRELVDADPRARSSAS